MNMNRRLFLGGLLALTAVKGTQLSAIPASNMPKIVGDGMFDDSAGLSALFNNEPVIFSKDLFQVDSHEGITILHRYPPTFRDFKVSNTIHIGKDVKIESEGPIRLYAPNFDEMSPLFSFYENGVTDMSKFSYELDMTWTKVPLLQRKDDNGAIYGKGNFYNPMEVRSSRYDEPSILDSFGGTAPIANRTATEQLDKNDSEQAS